jgi:hypothetical protein
LQLFPLFSVMLWNAARKNLTEPIDRTAWLIRRKGFETGEYQTVPQGIVPFIEAFTSHPWHLQVNDLYSRSFRVCFDELITGGDHTMAVDSLREFGEPQERAWSVYMRFLRSVASGSSGAAASVAPTPISFAGAHVAFVMRENMLRGGLRQRMFGNLDALRATSESDERVYKTSTLLFDGMPVASLFAVLDAVEILVGVYSGGPSRHSTTQHNTTQQQHSTTQQ